MLLVGGLFLVLGPSMREASAAAAVAKDMGEEEQLTKVEEKIGS